jgi:hypothetical protein
VHSKGQGDKGKARVAEQDGQSTRTKECPAKMARHKGALAWIGSCCQGAGPTLGKDQTWGHARAPEQRVAHKMGQFCGIWRSPQIFWMSLSPLGMEVTDKWPMQCKDVIALICGHTDKCRCDTSSWPKGQGGMATWSAQQRSGRQGEGKGC